MSQGPPKEWFEGQREVIFRSQDEFARRVSNGRFGVHHGRYVNLNTRKYVSTAFFDRVTKEAQSSFDCKPSRPYGSYCLSTMNRHMRLRRDR